MSVRFGMPRVRSKIPSARDALTFEVRDNDSWWLGGRAGGWVTLGASWMRQVHPASPSNKHTHPATSSCFPDCRHSCFRPLFGIESASAARRLEQAVSVVVPVLDGRRRPRLMPAVSIAALRELIEQRFPDATPANWRAAEPVATGVGPLDRILPGGGLPRGQLTVWTPQGPVPCCAPPVAPRSPTASALSGSIRRGRSSVRSGKSGRFSCNPRVGRTP